MIDDEIVSMVKRVREGIKINDEYLATDLIISKGPGANFLNTEHTAKYFKSDFFYPYISNRDNYVSWSKNGSLSIKNKARQKVRELLKNAPEELLDPIVIKKIRNIVKKEEKRMHIQ